MRFLYVQVDELLDDGVGVVSLPSHRLLVRGALPRLVPHIGV